MAFENQPIAVVLPQNNAHDAIALVDITAHNKIIVLKVFNFDPVQFSSLMVEGNTLLPPLGLRNIFHPVHRDTGQIHLNELFFPTAALFCYLCRKKQLIRCAGYHTISSLD